MKKEGESSLELLLDTMCNTFGGVIFITISLVVIISMTSSLHQNPVDQTVTTQDVESLQIVIENLKEQLLEADAQNAELQGRLESLSSDPRWKMLGELVALENAVATSSAKADIARSSLSSTQLANAVATKELQDAQETYQKDMVDLEKTNEDIDGIVAQIDALRMEQEANALSMVFTTLKGKSERPYWLVVQDGQVWRIGPDNDLYQPNEDVTATQSVLEDGDTQISCKVKTGKGTPIFMGDHLSAGFQHLLDSLPRDRVPQFLVPPESAEVFYSLRETLKQEGKFHGFQLLSDKNSYGYVVTHRKSDGIYEY